MATKRAAKTKVARTKPVNKKVEPTPYQEEREELKAGSESESEIESTNDREISFDTPLYRDPVSASTDNGLPPDFSTEEDRAENDSQAESQGQDQRSAKHRSSGASVAFGADGDRVDDDEQEDNGLPRRRMTSNSNQGAKSADQHNSSGAGASLSQKAKDIVTRGTEELSERYGHTFEDVKVASKKVQEEIKKQPHRIVLGAVGVVGLGLILAKRYTLSRSKSSTSSSDDSTQS